MRKIAVVINAHSGSMSEANKVRAIVDAFTNLGENPDVFLVHKGSELEPRMKTVLKGSYEIVVAAGGDGTVGAVGSYLVNTKIVFGILPVGTLNHLAKDLGIPLDIPAAVRTICEGELLVMDAGMVNGTVFLNNASVGMYPKIVMKREELKIGGYNRWTALFWAVWFTLRKFSYIEAVLSLNGTQELHKTPFIFVGNNEYEIEGLRLGGRQAMTDGKLCVYVSEETNRWKLLSLVARAVFGFLRAHTDFTALYTEYVAVHMRKQFVTIALDGELRKLETPLHFSVMPKSLKVLVPK